MNYQEAEQLWNASQHWYGYRYEGKTITDIIIAPHPMFHQLLDHIVESLTLTHRYTPSIHLSEYEVYVLFDRPRSLSELTGSVEYRLVTELSVS
jgi:hypothetical protein